MKQAFILVDGSSYFFRAFHALPPLVNSKGQPTGAIFGVVNMIRRLIKDHPSDHIAIVFDAKGKTFRNELYADYKAHRPPVPADLSFQFNPMVALLKAMGFPILIIDGVEADDVIGTLACQAAAKDIPVIISTSDKDMAQLVNDHITLINTMTNKHCDSRGVLEKYGVMPHQFIDYLALIGDSVDNVPGVHKCGPKTAVKWLTSYQTLENLMAHAHEIGGKIGENLQKACAYLPLSKQLVTIKTDIELPYQPEDLLRQPQDKARLIHLTQELEFKNWLRELLSPSSEPVTAQNRPFGSQPVPSYLIIQEIGQLHSWLSQVQKTKQFYLHIETRRACPHDEGMVGISMAISDQTPVYIPLAHDEVSLQLSTSTVLALLKPLLEDASVGKIGQNLKYIYQVLKKYGIQLHGITFDTMLASYVLNSSASQHDIVSLALKYLGSSIISYESIAGKGAKQLPINSITIEKAAAYTASQAQATVALQQKFLELLDAKQAAILNNIEIPLITVLAEMEYGGVKIDEIALAEHGKRLKARIRELESEAFQLANKSFNLNSPKQLQEIFFDELKLPVIAKTPTGQSSTAEAVLQELAYDYRLPHVILEYRSLSKLVSTYIDALPRCIHPNTGRVHTNYNQAVTATGRLSSSDPNLQNIPIRNEEGRLIRRAFVAPPHHVLLAADYSQIELRLMAHFSQDDALLHAFANRLDIHTATASEIFNIALDKVSHEQRRRAKAVNFGLIYGMSSFGLAKQIGVTRQEAERYIARYFERYPGVQDYMFRTRQQAHEMGYVETIFGRRLYLPEIKSSNLARRKAAERAAINAPLQGTAADIIKKAMLAIDNWQHQEHPPARMIMQVHDELIFEVSSDAVQACHQTIQTLMTQVVSLDVPIEVSVGWGQNWDEAH